MGIRSLIFAILVVAVTACDFSQKKTPETAAPVPGVAGQTAETLPWTDNGGAQNRGLRLMGPGVNRGKQTKI